MKNSRRQFAMISAGVVIACVAIATGQELGISRSTIDGGGMMRSTGGAFELSGTIGQQDAGTMSGGVFELAGGFWFAEAPADCNSDGSVNLYDYNDFEACLAGPAAGVGNGCSCFDVNESDTVDLRDFAVAQATFSGA